MSSLKWYYQPKLQQTTTKRNILNPPYDKPINYYKYTISIPAEIVKHFELQKGQTLNLTVIETEDGHMKLELEELARK